MIDEEVTSTEDFAWLSRLRYYCTENRGTASSSADGKRRSNKLTADDSSDEEDEGRKVGGETAKKAGMEIDPTHKSGTNR